MCSAATLQPASRQNNQHKKERPNIVLICVDQMRADALSCDGNEVVRTPYLDLLADCGSRFTHAYSATPTCVPARVALFTGQSPERHGRIGYQDGLPFSKLHPVTLAGELSKAGYQTQAIGKMHVYPERDRVGFDDVRLHDGFLHYSRRVSNANYRTIDDYITWLRRQPGMAAQSDNDHGIGCNSVVARPWDKPEAYHPTNWILAETEDWLYRRDVTDPFFLYLSFHRPHAPYDPPQWAWDQYENADIPDASIGDWEDTFARYRQDFTAEGKFGRQHPDVRRRAMQGYYGLISQIDAQINRLMQDLMDFNLYENTAFIFVSDHGDMLGDHYFYRKSLGYEGSARVPFIVKLPGERTAGIVDEVVELRDIMPTILDIAGVEIPESVDGRSVLPLMRADTVDCATPRLDTTSRPEWRTEIHGEHDFEVFGYESMQWVTDGHRKFIWWSGSGKEQFFDLDVDPQEKHNLIFDPKYHDQVQDWRRRLISYLDGREEGYVQDGQLISGRPAQTNRNFIQEKLSSIEDA